MPLPLFLIVNCDHIRLFQTLQEPEFKSNLWAHLPMPFHGSGLGDATQWPVIKPISSRGHVTDWAYYAFSSSYWLFRWQFHPIFEQFQAISILMVSLPTTTNAVFLLKKAGINNSSIIHCFLMNYLMKTRLPPLERKNGDVFKSHIISFFM